MSQPGELEPVTWVDAEFVDEEPQQLPVCWWRCGPNVRDDTKGARERGISYGLDGKQIIIRQGDYEIRPRVEHWQFGITHYGQGPSLDYLDLLCTKPPFLPEPVDWQRMTRWNDRRHPGNDMDRWEWDFDGPEQFFTD